MLCTTGESKLPEKNGFKTLKECLIEAKKVKKAKGKIWMFESAVKNDLSTFQEGLKDF